MNEPATGHHLHPPPVVKWLSGKGSFSDLWLLLLQLSLKTFLLRSSPVTTWLCLLGMNISPNYMNAFLKLREKYDFPEGTTPLFLWMPSLRPRVEWIKPFSALPC